MHPRFSLTFEPDDVVAGQTKLGDVAQFSVKLSEAGDLVVGKIQHTQVGKILQSNVIITTAVYRYEYMYVIHGHVDYHNFICLGISHTQVILLSHQLQSFPPQFNLQSFSTNCTTKGVYMDDPSLSWTPFC